LTLFVASSSFLFRALTVIAASIFPVQLLNGLLYASEEEGLQSTRIGRGREVRPIRVFQVVELVEVFRVPVEQSDHEL
jgi:hypothetical protein